VPQIVFDEMVRATRALTWMARGECIKALHAWTSTVMLGL
jgi:hypothetical protein